MRVAFGEYQLDTKTRTLQREGRRIPVQSKAFDLLAYLIEHRDQVVSSNELLDTLWPGLHVTPAALSTAVQKARQAVGDDGEHQAVLQTEHGQGFRFVAEVTDLSPPETDRSGSTGAVQVPLIAELKRRNVFRVAAAYGIVAWLLVEMASVVVPALHLPEWTLTLLVFLVVAGFPLAMILAWAFELTQEGIKRETAVDPAESITHLTGRKLDFAIIGLLVVAVVFLIVDNYVLEPDGTEVAAEQIPATQPITIEKSIAVLPFVNMSDDAGNEYFSDGLSEELLNLLARIPELKVAARTSSFSFKDKDLEVTEIASRLKVAYVLEGSVRKQGNQLRITAQLIQADNGYHLWSETYDRQLDNVFQIQEDIAIAVVDALRITLLGEVPKTRRTDPAAYQLFLEGQYLKRQLSPDSLNRAIQAFKQAVEIDPAYVPAWAELADTYIWGGGSDELSDEEATALADQAIQTAISTDPDYAFAYYVRGISWIFTKHRFKQGIEDFQHALKLDPDDAFIVAAIGKGAFLTGKFDLAITQYQAALAMEPIVPEFYWFLGMAYLSSGRLDDAEASFRKLLSLSPSSYGKHDLWKTLLLKGELEAALAESDTSFVRAIIHHALGNAAVADEALADLIENADPYSIAMVYGYRGDVDKTFEWLDYMLENSDYYPTWILTETAFRSIHSDPRWEPFLEKLGLLEFWLEMTPDWEH
jgi:TolB-like protein/DNA-binding winged helix-turn-helix (wHTH) protein